MTENKGGRGKRDPNSLKNIGVRLPPVEPWAARLLGAIAANRGGTKAEHIAEALIAYARIEEVRAADLIEE